MGWHFTKVNIPADAQSVNCTLICVQPWGDDSGENGHLSPVNAINSLHKKITATSGGVVVMLVTSGSLADFISQIGALAEVMPMPEVKRLHRSASSQASNASSRMQIPPPYKEEAAAGALTFSTLQAAAAAGRMAQAMQTKGAGGADGLKNALAGFQQKRQQMAEKVVQAVAATAAKSANVWAFTGDDVSASREQMLRGVPSPQNAWALALAFIGDVAQVKGWLASQREDH